MLVVLPVIVGVGMASYLLYNDYHSKSTSDDSTINREVIGEIVYSDNNVKRQFDNDVLWNAIDKKSPIYNRDSVRTGQNSNAAIKLLDNTMVELNESSLIVLDKSQGSLNLKFKAGDITTRNSGKDLQISVNNSIIKGEGADIKLKESENGANANIQVSKGKATVTDKNKKSAEVNQSEEAGLINGDLQEINQIAVKLKTPQNRSQILATKGNYRQAFTWEVTRPSLKTEQFEISKTSNFEPGSNTQIYKAHQAISPALSVGAYFWRVGWLTDKPAQNQTKPRIAYTETRQITISTDTRLDLTFPEDESQFDFQGDENSIEFQWKCQIPVKVFVFEVASALDFRKIVFTKILSETTEILKDLAVGNYFWRVRAFGEHNDELAVSGTRTFSVHTKIKPQPELVKPEADSNWESTDPLEFSWKKLESASDYRLLISRDLAQKEIVKTKSLKTTNFVSPPLTQGIYYWSVRATNKKSLVVGQSEVRKIIFKIKPKSQAFILDMPKEKSILSRESSDSGLEPILFQWQVTRTLPGPVTLTISQTSDFKDAVIQEGITKSSTNETLTKSGVYYWRLSSNPSPPSKAKTSEESETGTFTLRVANNFEAPTLIEPADHATVELLTIDSPSQIVKFSWTPMPTAFQYHIIVERQTAKKAEPLTVIDRMVKEWNLNSPPLGPGNYSWSVSSVTSDGTDGGQSKPFSFNIVQPVEMDAPKLNQPVVK